MRPYNVLEGMHCARLQIYWVPIIGNRGILGSQIFNELTYVYFLVFMDIFPQTVFYRASTVPLLKRNISNNFESCLNI